MKRLCLSTGRLAIVVALAMPLSACYGITMRSGQASFVTPADTAIYCGAVREWRGETLPYPYTLHVSASAGSSAGRFRITFRDRDSMGFEVPAGRTNSTTHALGGVRGVDDVVKITAEGGVQSMMARVELWLIVSSFYSGPGDPLDPFDETRDNAPARFDNFCITARRDPGATSAAQLIP